MDPEKEDRRIKKLFNIPIESQKPNIGPLPMSTDLRAKLQNFLSEAEKVPMPENAENKKLIEFVEDDQIKSDSNDSSSSDESGLKEEDDQTPSNNVLINLYIPKKCEKKISPVEEINDV
uniref:Uncharacterized protein n=1 Tax=Strongyloides venezuelensis TaxID=75913 RepID=A0A0K0F8A5_STRVS